MDVVDLLIWNEFDESRVWDEYPRIAVLCEWGKKWGIDGYVRYVTLTPIRVDLWSIYVLPSRMQMDLWVYYYLLLCL